jgi:uncharacterized 2Fe-2S/4Fe-4S cluster protein (DUF4445 family)
LSEPILLLDIGTTTISADIFDSCRKKVLSTGMVLNSQARFGKDIVSRIGFALQHTDNPALLKKALVFSINLLARRLASEAGLDIKDIKSAVCASNSAIHHMLLGLDLSTLVSPPYRPVQKSEITIKASALGIRLAKDAQIQMLPNLGGFVGSDALCVILSSRIFSCSQPRLAIDIGTNGEIMLGNKHRIIVASAAAGPAFEAGYIKNGMPAVKGAIDKVKIVKGKPVFHVIGNVQPTGITGSGLIDACYEMLRAGIIQGSGKLNSAEFIVFKNAAKKIAVTQADIRKLQLAKAAIAAGVKILIKQYKTDIASIDRIVFTGSFGNSLSKKGIMGIGIIPKTGMHKVHYLANGVLAGLRLYAISPAMRNQLTAVSRMVEHRPLFGKNFADEFSASLSFGQGV